LLLLIRNKFLTSDINRRSFLANVGSGIRSHNNNMVGCLLLFVVGLLDDVGISMDGKCKVELKNK
jgi:hypothetical protein